MVGHVDALITIHLKSEPGKSGGALHGKVRGKDSVREAETKLVEQTIADHIIVRVQKAPIVFAIHIVRQ